MSFHEMYLLDHYPDTFFLCCKSQQMYKYLHTEQRRTKNVYNSSFTFVMHLHTNCALLTVPHKIITYTKTQRRSQRTASDEAAPGSTVQKAGKNLIF